VGTRKYFKELRLQQFRSLVQTGRFGSFTAAARELDLSRTSVWQQIRALEEDFGIELIVVVDHQPQLTAEGQLLFEMLSPLVEAFDAVKETFLTQINRVKQRVTIATTTSLLNYELSEPTTEFRKKFPDVSLSFIDRTSISATELLSGAKADIAVVGRIKAIPNEENLDIRHLVNCPFVLACNKKNELASRRNIQIKDLVKYPLIIPSSGTNGRYRIDSVFEQAGLDAKIQVAMQSYNTSVMMDYAEKGLGVALLSLSPALQKLHTKRMFIHDFSGVFGHEEVIVARRKSRFEKLERKYVDEFVKMVFQHNS
jgi:DNA-binding transcriptional LysR family regulator